MGFCASRKRGLRRRISAVGGAKALDALPSPEAAAAFGDTIYRHGAGDGARAIQFAINAVEKGKVAEDGKMGPETFKAFNELATDLNTKRELLEALGEQRNAITLGRERERTGYFTFRSQR